MLGNTNNEEFKRELSDDYQQYDESYNLIGTFNIRWYPTKENAGSIGGVCRVDTTTNTAKHAGWRGEPDGKEFQLPTTFFWTQLNEHQMNAFIKPTAPRERPAPPASLCPPPPAGATNYPITNPESSFLPRHALKDTQVYLTHDNGSRPFKVFAHQNAIEVYTDKDDLVWDEKQIYNDRIGCYTEFLGIWPGYDSADYTPQTHSRPRKRVKRVKRRVRKIKTQDENNDDGQDHTDGLLVRHCSREEYGQIHRANGNSVLIQLTPTSYVHVGCEVYAFETDEPIVNYFSPRGNNDVPYPVV